MVNQFAFDIVAAFYCSTCDCVREVCTTVTAPVAEPLISQLFMLSSQQERKCPVCGSDIPPEAQCGFRPAGDVETWHQNGHGVGVATPHGSRQGSWRKNC